MPMEYMKYAGSKVRDTNFLDAASENGFALSELCTFKIFVSKLFARGRRNEMLNAATAIRDRFGAMRKSDVTMPGCGSRSLKLR